MVKPRRISLYTLFALTWTLFAVAMLSGCLVQSLQPFYDRDTLVTDDRLLGTFGGEDPDGFWTFSADDDGYRLLHHEEGTVVPASVHLARVDGRLYMDFSIEEMPEDTNDWYGIMFVPSHMVLRVDELGDTLLAMSLKEGWLRRHLEDNPDAIAHVVVESRIVLTDDTEALQRFYAAHADNEDAWEQAVRMQRRPTDAR